MPEQPTDKSKYLSKYAPETYVTAAQFIAELICEKIAYREKTKLVDRFWNLDKWGKKFRYQVSQANKLLQEYDALSIIRAIKSPAATKIVSLGARFILIPLIEKEQSILNSEKESLISGSQNTLDKPRVPVNTKQTLYGKLRDRE